MHDLCIGFERAAKSENLPRPVVHSQVNGVKVFLSQLGQIGAFWQILAQQAVGVLIGAALPGAVRVAEVHLHAGLVCKLAVGAHFPALIVGNGLA